MDPTPGSRDKAFNSGGIQGPSKLFLFRFDSGNDRNGKEFFIYSPIQLENLANFGVCFSFQEVSGMAFLPKEFAGTQERLYG